MNAEQMLFLRSVVPGAQMAQRATGIPASITIAQAVLESGWGKSGLAVKANNLFGIKAAAHSAPDQYVEFPTAEFINGKRQIVQAGFARYATPADCMDAHAHLLADSKRYRPAMAVAGDPSAFATQLQACGYSTNPNYAVLLMRLVNQFDLTQYDVAST